MIAPTTRIYDWFLRLPTDVQNELCTLVCPLHYDTMIVMATDDLTAVRYFLKYLQTDQLPYTQVVTRAIFTRGLIDYAFKQKTAPAYWEQVAQNADWMITSTALARLPKDARRHFKRQLAARKQLWHSSSRSWAQLKGRHLHAGKITAFEQHGLLGAIKNGAHTPFQVKDGRPVTDYILRLWPQPEVLGSFLLITEQLKDASPIDPSAYWAAAHKVILGKTGSN